MRHVPRPAPRTAASQGSKPGFGKLNQANRPAAAKAQGGYSRRPMKQEEPARPKGAYQSPIRRAGGYRDVGNMTANSLSTTLSHVNSAATKAAPACWIAAGNG